MRSLIFMLLIAFGINTKTTAQCVQVSLSPVIYWTGPAGTGSDSITITITANTIPKRYRLFNNSIQWSPVIEFPLSFVIPTSTKTIAVTKNTPYSFEIKSVTNAGVVDNVCNSDVIPFSYTGTLAISNLLSSKIVNNLLIWSMAKDDDVERYVIEKSQDGAIFNVVVTIPSRKSYSTVSYTTLLECGRYYRIKMIHSNGMHEYTTVLRGNICKEIVTVYPNPVLDQITITGLTHSSHIISIYNSIGIRVRNVVTANNTIHIPMQDLAKGIYQVKIDSKVIKIIKL